MFPAQGVEGATELIIAKNRNGPTGFVDLYFYPRGLRFEDVMEFEGFIDRKDWVVVPWSARLRGRGSGIPIEVTETYAVQAQDAKIVRVDEYRTKEQALEAVG